MKLSFSLVDDLAFAGERGRLLDAQRLKPAAVGELGPLLELRQLVDAGVLQPLEQLALVHTNAPQEAQTLYQRAKHLFPTPEEPLSVDVTPVLGTHIGPGVVGFTCITAQDV